MYAFSFQQDYEEITLTYEYTRTTPLVDNSRLGETTSCVLNSGQIILYGRTSRQDTPKLYLFNKDGTYTGIALVATCRHYYDMYLLAIAIDKDDVLVVSCVNCNDIKLKNVTQQDKKPIVAYRGGEDLVNAMCLGPKGSLFIAHRVNGEVLELSCNRTSFKLKNSFAPVVPRCAVNINNICYAASADLIVLSSMYNRRVCAFSRKGQLIWDRCITLNFNPEGIVYLPDSDLLLIGDLYNREITVLSVKAGDRLNTFDLDPTEVMSINHLHVDENQLVIRYQSVRGEVKMAWYSVSCA